MATFTPESAAGGAYRKPPESLGDYAIRALREDLIEGRLVPGQRISMEVLATEMGISHVPLREAIRYLEAEGHLERDPRSQVRVAPVSPEEAAEIYRLREILETEANARGVPALTDADIAELDAQLRAMEQAVADDNIARFASANRAFHFVAFERAGSKWMLRFMNIVWDAAARYQTSLFQQEGWEENLQAHHRQLRDAMARRDADEVHRIMDEHRRVTIEASRNMPGASGTDDEEVE
jgi:DNA-binding GntR family transcriptional regulator